MKRQATEGWALIPEGEQIIRIKEIDESDYDKFQKITVVYEDASGSTGKENFNFVKDDGTPNAVADGIYTRMGRTLLDDQTLDEIDSDELVGCYALVEIQHTESSKGGTFANIKKWLAPAKGFNKTTSTTKSTASATKKKTAAELLAEARAKAKK